MMKIINNSIKKLPIYFTSLLIFGLLCSSGCKKKGIEVPTKRVEIQILDGTNQIVTGADISVYYNENAFRKDILL